MITLKDLRECQELCHDLAEQERRGVIDSVSPADHGARAGLNEVLRLRIAMQCACHYLRQNAPGLALDVLQAELDRPEVLPTPTTTKPPF